MNRKIIGEVIYIRVSDRKLKSDSHETWKCVNPEWERQIRCFPYGERSDVPWLQQVEQKAVALHDGSYLMQRAKLFAYVNNNIQITWKTI
jgi:hypothetical protein